MEAFRFMLRQPREFALYAGLGALGISVIVVFAGELNQRSFGIAQLAIFCLVFVLWTKLVYRQSGTDLGQPPATVKPNSANSIFLYGLMVFAPIQLLTLVVSVLLAPGIGADVASGGLAKLLYLAAGISFVAEFVVWSAFTPTLLVFPGRALGYGTTLGQAIDLSTHRRGEIWRAVMIGGSFSVIGTIVTVLVVVSSDSLPMLFLGALAGNLLAVIGLLFAAYRLTYIYIAAMQAAAAKPAG
jgi:hypothetical protein